ncbi:MULTISPECIES: NAD(P)H-binding protein [unclassified Lentimicrobium]|uniref:NAD(P)H-binding protein n=1 Tax=unclassified Lentimicrobium TaxID=2677434 RepID=UPI001556870A|nr:MULTISPECIES: NAD(P)H-binding protein [unclassified Lentimicrobium]NPD47689.1 NAD(P)H-binding protein [Lentimicrobium sp. S6]NPD86121.1 NAD(P)H-binding protein [Lentimicrobium sp. L6]
MKIAVTTASGNLGSTIIEHLKLEIGKENVIGIARTPEKAAFLDVEIRRGDYNNKAEFVEALKGVDAVLLVSGMDHPDKRIQQHRNVIEAAKENGVKKIVYTSIMGAEEGNAFSPVVASNRQTEEDVKNSGLDWAIGRNGIYIEPDLEYIETYEKEGGIINSAGNGKCGYTSRKELAFGYYNLLIKDDLNGGTYNMYGESITQQELADSINAVYGTHLKYQSVSVAEYTQQRKAALGEFLGTVIGGIYEGINAGKYDAHSDFLKVTGREHHSAKEMIQEYLAK